MGKSLSLPKALGLVAEGRDPFSASKSLVYGQLKVRRKKDRSRRRKHDNRSHK